MNFILTLIIFEGASRAIEAYKVLLPDFPFDDGRFHLIDKTLAKEWYHHHFNLAVQKVVDDPEYYILVYKFFLQTGLKLWLVDEYLLGWCLLDSVINAVFPGLDKKQLCTMREKLAKILLEFLEHCTVQASTMFLFR